MRDDFSEATKRIVAARVAYRCSHPECRAATAGPRLDAAKALSAGVAAHITAASKLGPRFDATLSVEQRKSIENAIWLCQNCAKLVDNDPERFAVAVLREWKTVAEQTALLEVGKTASPDGTDAGEILALLKKFQPDIAAEFLFRQGYEALRSADPDLAFKVDVEEGGITIAVASTNGAPISVAFDPVFPDTEKGRRKAAEFAAFLDQGTPVELDETNVPFDALPEVIRPSAAGRETFRLRLGPRRPRTFVVALIFRNAEGDNYEFPYIEFRSNRFELPEIILSNAQQLLPFHIELRLRPDKSATFDWAFNFARKGFYWVWESLKFRSVLSKPCAIIVRDLEDGTEHVAAMTDGSDCGEDVPPEFVEFVERVLTVQRRTRSPILVPKREYPTEQDEQSLRFIEHILANGCQIRPPDRISVTVLRPDGRSLLQELVEGRRPLAISQSSHCETLLGNQIPLGPMELYCRHVQAHPDDREKLERLLQGDEVTFPSHIRVIAREGEIIETRYPMWCRGSDGSPAG
jgi:hypothetical protein